MGTLISKDGTNIEYNKIGSGKPLILVDGAFYSKDFGPVTKLAPLLAKNYTVFTYDRRAKGESGDTKPYSVEKEIEDIAGLIDLAGGSAFLFGASSGAILALKAVASGLAVPKLALFEPPFVGNPGNKRPANAFDLLSDMIAKGNKGEAAAFFLRKVVGVPALMVFLLRLNPDWKKMKANANSLPHELAVCGDFHIPANVISAVRCSTLVIDSIKSTTSLRDAAARVANALPDGLQKSLHGSSHDVAPEILAPELAGFFK
jgi:pimeloyl-ACP methyl ester carboxylesterase